MLLDIHNVYNPKPLACTCISNTPSRFGRQMLKHPLYHSRQTQMYDIKQIWNKQQLFTGLDNRLILPHFNCCHCCIVARRGSCVLKIFQCSHCNVTKSASYVLEILIAVIGVISLIAGTMRLKFFEQSLIHCCKWLIYELMVLSTVTAALLPNARAMCAKKI